MCYSCCSAGVAAIIGPADARKEMPGKAEAKDYFAGDGAEGHAVACAMAREQKARLAIEERNLNHRQRDASGVCAPCATHCAHRLADGKKEHLSCLMHCRDCATCCAACCQVCARGGPLSAVMADCCAKCCDHCAKACEVFPDDQHMKACDEECRKCEKACKAIAK